MITYFHQMDSYLTIEKTSFAEYKERGSKFIAYTYPIQNISDFKKHLAELKKEHGKATHHCFAYRLGYDGNTFRVSDDGEPSGTAGKPILGQIDSKSLTNILIVVVRYFGGTMLGVPGLINAYKTAAVMALQLTPIVTKQIETVYTIRFDYTQINSVMQVIKVPNCTIIEQTLQLFCEVKISLAKSIENEVLQQLKENINLEVVKI